MRSQLKQADIDKNSSPYHYAEYNYRKDGNLDSRTINSSTTSFTYAGDLMDTASGGEGFDLDWDDNGNMTTGVSETFTYNWDNKLRSASALSGNIRYDPSGNRVRKLSVVVGDRKYIVDIVGGLPTTLMEMTDNTILKTYIYANGQVLCQHDGDYSAPRYFYIHDRLGSTRQIINTSGSVVRYYTYEPFGEVLEEDGTLTNYMMFTGQYFDTEIDQYYLRARQYDLHISRFTARDPVFGKYKEPLTLHAYLYCLNEPINRIDPFGLAYTPAGGPHYDWDQTRAIISHARSTAYGGLSNAVYAFARSGLYDYKSHSFTFEIGDPERPSVLTGSEFGNYITSFVTYYLYGHVGLLGTRVGGEWLELRDKWRFEPWPDNVGQLLSRGGFDDVGSKCLIYKGALDAHREMPGRTSPLAVIDEFQLMINYYHYYGLYFVEQMSGYLEGGSFHWGL